MQMLFTYAKVSAAIVNYQEAKLYSTLRIFLVFLVAFFSAQQLLAQDMPYTFEGEGGGLVSTLGGIVDDDNIRERGTCDIEFWDVLKKRAWMEAQREITQNANLIPKADSVMSMSCFNGHLDHLGWYSDRNFPNRPNQSIDDAFLASVFDTFWFDLGLLSLDTLVTAAKLSGDRSAMEDTLFFSNGFQMYATLELLVLDQLWESDSEGLADILSGDAYAMILAASCGKKRWVQDNFAELMLGDRARALSIPSPTAPEDSPGPTWSNLEYDMDEYIDLNRTYNDSIDQDNSYACTLMNDVWMRAKCYDFATEAPSDVHRVDLDVDDAVNLQGGRENHDGFYTLKEYAMLAGYDDPYDDPDAYDDFNERTGDMRVLAGQCAIPDTDGFNNGDDDGTGDSGLSPGTTDEISIDFPVTIAAIQSSVDSGDFPEDIDDFISDNLDEVWDAIEDSFTDFLGGGSASPLMCSILSHGFSYDGSELPWQVFYPFPGTNPTWDTAYQDANQVAGWPGALDAYIHYQELRDYTLNGDACADPIQTGFVVYRENRAPYVDAVCPTPGCWFNPPSDLSGLGECER